MKYLDKVEIISKKVTPGETNVVWLSGYININTNKNQYHLRLNF
jgi:hypothetical protein